MTGIKTGDRVRILDSGRTGIVVDYFDDSWIVVASGDAEYHLKRDQIESDAESSDSSDISSTTQGGAIGIVFKAVKSSAGDFDIFNVYLFNRYGSEFPIAYHYFLDGEEKYQFHFSLRGGDEKFLHVFRRDHVHDHPVFVVEGENESGLRIQDELKLRPKQLHNILNSQKTRETGEFEINLRFVEQDENKITPDIKVPLMGSHENEEPDHIVLSKSKMPDYIDLHAEHLIPGFRRMEAGEILQLQLRHFRQFLEDAIRLELHHIYVVHGFGKGVLKYEIEKILADYPEVISWNNDYSPRFGFGATGITLA